MRTRLLDLALLAVVIGWGQLDVWAPQVTTPNHMVGDARVLSGSYLVAGLALAVRRRWPLAATGGVLAGFAVPTVLYGSSEGLGGFLLICVALYALGAYADLRQALLGLFLTGVLFVLFLARDSTMHDAGDLLRGAFYLLPLLLPFAFGLVVRNPRLRALEWERRAMRLERERQEAERTAVEVERSRIARELHDIVAHSVSMIVLQAEAGDSRLDRDQAAAHEAFHSIEDTARQAMIELRRLLGLLRDQAPNDLLPQPRLAGLPALLEGVGAAGLRTTLEVIGVPVRVAPGLELNAYRIVQEALTNSLRHAHATHARVTVAYTPAGLELEVVDDGRARRVRDGTTGHGLIGMRERVLIHGGELEAKSQEAGGFRVWARLPVESAP